MGPRITSLAATVRTERGRKTLRRGDVLPEDALPGEAERLAGLGAYGTPSDRNADTRDEAQVLADELAREHAEQSGEEPQVAVEEAGEEGESGELEPEEDRVGLAAYLKTASVSEVLDRVGKEPDIASVLLDLERESDKPRKSLIGSLQVAVEEAGEE